MSDFYQRSFWSGITLLVRCSIFHFFSSFWCPPGQLGLSLAREISPWLDCKSRVWPLQLSLDSSQTSSASSMVADSSNSHASFPTSPQSSFHLPNIATSFPADDLHTYAACNNAAMGHEEKPYLDIILDAPYLALKGTGPDVEPTTLRGHVALHLPESTSIKEITLQFRGKARVPVPPSESCVILSESL